MGSQAVAGLTFRSFNLGWRWFGAPDLFVLGKCVLAGSAVSIFVVWAMGMRDYSRGVVLIYMFLVFGFMVGLRVSLQFLWQTLGLNRGCRRAAVLGADVAGEIVVLVLQRDIKIGTYPVLILDPDPASQHMRVHGVPVRHAGADAPQILKQSGVEVLIAPADATRSPERLEIIAACSRAGFPVEQFELSLRALAEEETPALAESL
jgi:FlaA1/EpsC-like NDP-sugar epimerase